MPAARGSRPIGAPTCPRTSPPLRGRFDTSGSLEGRLADGPYVAYLLREGRWIQPGRVPEGAIRLGEIRIVRSDGSYPTRAVVTFEVPELPTSWYYVGYCNEPCTVDGIGDLIGSERFIIAPTRAEGRAIVRIDRLEARVDVVRQRAVARTRAERKRLEDEVADPVTVVRGITEREPSVTWWIALLACVVGLAVGLAVGRRRFEASIVVPDTVPHDLERREPVLPR